MSDGTPERAVVFLSGIPGVGKTTLARGLARSLPRAVHLESDLLQEMIVSGGLWPDREPHDEAMRQLGLRLRNAALLADSFFDAGFTVVVDDVIIGSRLDELCATLRSRPLYFVMLTPDLETARARNAARDKDVFEQWAHLDSVVRNETRRVGLWLDTTGQSAEQSLAELRRRVFVEAEIHPH